MPLATPLAMPLARSRHAVALLTLAALAAFPAHAQNRYADGVLRYDPLFNGGPAPAAAYQNTAEALGAPNGVYLTLGRGGLVELAFLDNVLTNSGSAAPDLYIYEVGPDVEDTYVAIRPTAATLALLGAGFDANGDGYFEIGKVFGATSTINIDAFFPGYLAGTLRFDAVQLIDDRLEGDISGATVGADIDAVEALTSAPPTTTPEPSTLALVGIAVGGAGMLRRARR